MILVQKRNHQAFSVIYERYAERMKAFFFRMLWSNAAMAEDFVHDLFAKIIEKPELYQSNRPFMPWLFQVASNMCKNAYRKKIFETNYLQQLDPNEIDLPNTEKELDEKIIKNHLTLLLEQLDEDKRELFLLRYQQELSVKALASTFEVSEGTIKSRLFYIRKTLAEALSKHKII